MPIPDYETLMLPVLHLFNNGAENVAECVPKIREQFGVTEDEAEELLPSGRTTILQSRVHWARTYLSKAGMLTSPKRNQHLISDKGRALIATNPATIDNALLEQQPEFREWRNSSNSSNSASTSNTDGMSTTPPPSQKTPLEAMSAAHDLINAELRDELISILLQVSPQRFEHLILDLLQAMQYGGGDASNLRMTKTTGDGGIDGIVNEDALGLDAVYIQAKRYALDNKVGRPDIQRFVGSLTGESASKGLFVTTSDFSKEAVDYVDRVQQRIVLVNGKRLAELMITYRVGVRNAQTFSIRTIDEDYFRTE